MHQKSPAVLLLVMAFVAAPSIVVQSYPCPDPRSIQDPSLATTFNLTQFLGDGQPYYELALHDYTQPDVCGCMRSVKTMPYANATWIHDNFTMVCPWNVSGVSGKIYISDLSFNLTSQRGVLEGHWALVPGVVFPDTVVAVGLPDSPGAPYRWALEFQCVQVLGNAAFVGINFYSRDREGEAADRSYIEMYDAALKYGIDAYWKNTTAGLRRLNHTGCFY